MVLVGLHGAIYRREREAETWALTDRRTRQTAEKLGRWLGELSRSQSHTILPHRYKTAISRASIGGSPRCDKGKLLNTRSVQNIVKAL